MAPPKTGFRGTYTLHLAPWSLRHFLLLASSYNEENRISILEEISFTWTDKVQNLIHIFNYHDDTMPSFTKDLHNIHESCQGSSVLDTIFTPRRKVFSTWLREMKGFCHWADCCVVVWITFITANASIL
ncbi:hypothetical protein AVEN_25638-1 [Araneus ventricosus]|uniref:Uncharacterized protein n=1 Tax=Araneus ventricosus TaxID=182803 RepID=A0A4Y2BQU3_ARAVE|nr:hypothetical protein AVEN_25638-1 [Araneus ventricosus]